MRRSLTFQYWTIGGTSINHYRNDTSCAFVYANKSANIFAKTFMVIPQKFALREKRNVPKIFLPKRRSIICTDAFVSIYRALKYLYGKIPDASNAQTRHYRTGNAHIRRAVTGNALPHIRSCINILETL